MLSDEAIDNIAHEVRTLPLTAVGRHVMPLIEHITEMDNRTCQSCRHWVAYNAGDDAAPRGECLYHASEGALTQVEAHGEAVEAVAHLTPFDWQCKGWERRADLPGKPGEPQCRMKLF